VSSCVSQLSPGTREINASVAQRVMIAPVFPLSYLAISPSPPQAISTLVRIFRSLTQMSLLHALLTISMHTTGEPMRIVIRRINHLLVSDRLFSKREHAEREFDSL
jgi:hypothetical protein